MARGYKSISPDFQMACLALGNATVMAVKILRHDFSSLNVQAFGFLIMLGLVVFSYIVRLIFEFKNMEW